MLFIAQQARHLAQIPSASPSLRCASLLTSRLPSQLIGFIVGGTVIICSNTRTFGSDTSSFISLPNQQRIDKLVGNISALRRTQASCDEDQANDKANFYYWGDSSLCCNLRLCTPSSSAKEKLDDMLSRFDCDVALFEQLKDDYEYVRDSNDKKKTCDVSRRPDVTTLIGGVPIVRSAVECHAGWALVAQSCAALPADCWADDDPEVLVARELVTKYRCSDAASDALAPYVSFPVDDLNASARPPTRTAAAPTLSPPPLPATAPPRPRAPMTRADGAPRLHPARARPAQRPALTCADPPCRPG